MWMLLAVTAAFAVPTGSLAPVTDHGNVLVGASLSGEGRAGAGVGDLNGFPARSLRVDWIPTDGFGVFGDVTYASQASDVTRGGIDRSWSLAAGARGAVWITRVLGVGVLGRAQYGRDWTLLVDDSRDDELRRALFNGTAGAIWGARGGRAYAWAGPSYTLRGTDAMVVGSSGWRFAKRHRIGMEIGGELASDDLLAQGLRGEMHMFAGASLHFIDAFGVGVYLGVGF